MALGSHLAIKECIVPSISHPKFPLTFGFDVGNMLRNQRVEVTGPIIYRVAIIRRFPTAQCVSVLPVHIPGNTCRTQRRSLPRSFNRCFAGPHSIFFQDARFSDFDANGAVVRDPWRAPGVCFAPYPSTLIHVFKSC
jgi:hypothetical protein